MTKLIYGTDDDDSLDGGSGADVMFGYGGDDLIAGAAGADILLGDSLFIDQVNLVSTDSDGVQGDALSRNARFSADGLKVVFESFASNFVAGDTLGASDIFVKDLLTGELTLVSNKVGTGQAGDGASRNASLSNDGKMVVFTTEAGDLIGRGDSNGASDIYLKNLANGQMTVVSRSQSAEANGGSDNAMLSADGKLVLFDSFASNLVTSDGNGTGDIFLKSLTSGALRRLSVNEDGVEGDGASRHALFSADGKSVSFESLATNLVAADTNGFADVFVKDMLTGDVTLISESKSHVQGNGTSVEVSLSADGKYALFTSAASNLKAGDTNGSTDVFLKNLVTGAVRIVSTDFDGVLGNGASRGGVFSPDGTRVAFFSDSTNLVPGDTNSVNDVFVKDLITGEVVRMSYANSQVEGDDASTTVRFSADGTHLIFDSVATNLVGLDGNGVGDVFVTAIDPSTGGDDVLQGGAGNDTLLPGLGGDTVDGGDGNDLVLMRGQLDSGDLIDGGAGFDTVQLDGDYIELLTFGLMRVESLVLKGHHTYHLAILNDPTTTSLIVDGSAVDAAHRVAFDGSAEQNGAFNMIGGAGNDIFSGAGSADLFDLSLGGSDWAYGGDNGSDTFVMGATLDATDRLDGGTGDDQVNEVVLNGDYSSNLVLAADTMTNINLVRFVGGFDYELTVQDANFNWSGATINASQLDAGDFVYVNAIAETSAELVFLGHSGNDYFLGGAAADTFILAGGIDVVNGAFGDDTIAVGSFTSGDQINGGGGAIDTMSVTSVTSGLTITSAMMTQVEFLVLGGGAAYNFQTADNVVAANEILRIDAKSAGSVIFNGTAESNGRFDITDSAGNDTLTGGAKTDQFQMHSGGNDTANGGGGDDRFVYDSFANLAGDALDGGTGTDVIELTQLFGAGTVTLASGLVNIEQILWAGANKLDLTTVDANVASGKTLLVDGNFDFNGSAETNGKFDLRGTDNDNTLTGGAGADTIRGGIGRDTITGGGGADIFRYINAQDSYYSLSIGRGSMDWVKDFKAGADKFDLTFAVASVHSAVSMASLGNVAGIAAFQAAVLTVTAGPDAGKYLIINDDGSVGFDLFTDYIVEITGGSNLASLSTADFI